MVEKDEEGGQVVQPTSAPPTTNEKLADIGLASTDAKADTENESDAVRTEIAPRVDVSPVEQAPIADPPSPPAESVGQRIRKDPVAWINLLFTGILALVACLQIWLLVAADRTATKAADAAVENVRVIKTQLRAAIGFDAASITNIDVAGDRTVVIDIKNTGSTPAYNFTHWIGMRAGPYPRNFELASPGPGEIVLAKSYLPPGGAVMKRHTIPALTDEERAAVKAGSMAIYVWGEIRWTDAFGESHRWFYRRMQGGGVGVNGEALGHSPEGDDAD